MTQPFNIVRHFFEAAKRHPDTIAIIHQKQQVTFREFEQQVLDTAAYFTEKGIGKGDRVMLFVPMSIDLYRIVLALFHIGATAVFLDEWVSKKRLEACCQVAQCQAFIGIFKARVLALFTSELRKIPIKLGTGYKQNSRKNATAAPTTASDTALITFTTGSTGTPKAAKRTHGFLHEQFQALLEKIDPHPDDIDMPVLPIVLLINLGAGCTSVIADFKASKPNSLKPEKVVRQLQKHRVTRLVASPFFVKQLAKYCIEHAVAVPSLEKLFTGGAPVFPAEAALYVQAFPEATIEIVYGSTEAEPISAITATALLLEKDDLLQQGLKVGAPYRKAEVRIVQVKVGAIACESEAELAQLQLRPGQIGEIIVAGPHVLQEYLNNEEALKQNKIFIGEKCWHRTGDSGYLNEKGELYLTGRCSTLLHTNGNLLAPFLYENYFSSLAGVEMGTVLQLNGELTAVLELKPGADKAAVQEQVTQAGQFEVRFVSKIPRDPRHNSKIDYERLRVQLV
ncbi:AMP-binding protein [Botryobacter ruber]|uniref:AMP-binding protein n=1 Tax=Botryobacter ruber TaxID=2171629 RepID=UPI000E09F720|nr:AMP-binding protein [Botryobacter ruber]